MPKFPRQGRANGRKRFSINIRKRRARAVFRCCTTFATSTVRAMSSGPSKGLDVFFLPFSFQRYCHRRVCAGRVRLVGQQLQADRLFRRVRAVVRPVVAVPARLQGTARVPRIPDCQK